MAMKKNQKGKIVIFKPKGGKGDLEVRLEEETVWLSQSQMANLFATERSVITKHINNIFRTKELQRNSVCAKFAQTASDDNSYQSYYEFD